MKGYRFQTEAEGEYLEAVAWLAARNPRAAARFQQELFAAIDRVRGMPQMYARVDGTDARECILQVFSYSVVYIDEPDHVTIIAVAHNKCEPGYWVDRLTEDET